VVERSDTTGFVAHPSLDPGRGRSGWDRGPIYLTSLMVRLRSTTGLSLQRLRHKE